MKFTASRAVSVFLIADLAALALAGCGAPPAPLAQPAAATPPAMAVPAAVAAARLGVEARAVVPSRERVHSVAPAVFAKDYAEADLNAGRQLRDEPALAQQVEQELKARSVSGGGANWGLIGGGIGAGVLGTAFLGYFVYAGMVGSRDLMYPARSTATDTPADFGDAFEAVTFKSHDGLDLKGWYVPAETPTTRGLVVLHGHGSNKNTMYKKYGHWLNQKYNLFVYDSRFHGESQGKFATLGYFERKDALIAIAQLKSRGVTSLGLLGESMGGAVAISAGAVSSEVKAVWNDCAFSSLHDAVAPRAKARKYPMADGVAFSVVKTASIRAKAKIDEADPVKWVGQLEGRPFYLVHGQADADTTPINGEKLFTAAKEPRTVWRTADTKHAESVEKYPAEYQQRAFAFFDAAL